MGFKSACIPTSGIDNEESIARVARDPRLNHTREQYGHLRGVIMDGDDS